MFAEVLDYLHNWFIKSRVDGEFTIEANVLTPCDALVGQYIRIEGSIFNDGVYKYGVDSFVAEETFNGSVYLLAIPRDLERLVDEISDFVETYGYSDIQSESFGGYSYTRKSGENGNSYGWVDEFRGRLKRWRKLPNE